jgi:hypothetical protein
MVFCSGAIPLSVGTSSGYKKEQLGLLPAKADESPLGNSSKN